jgi:hypothetical protein
MWIIFMGCKLENAEIALRDIGWTTLFTPDAKNLVNIIKN